MKRAIVVSGLASNENEMQEIIDDLESKGYIVEYFPYRHLKSLPDLKSGDVVIGHSAGATRVELEYQKSDARVISLDSPSRIGDGEFYSNVLDPVSIIGFIMNPASAAKGSFIKLAWNPHDKNSAYAQVSVE